MHPPCLVSCVVSVRGSFVLVVIASVFHITQAWECPSLFANPNCFSLSLTCTYAEYSHRYVYRCPGRGRVCWMCHYSSDVCSATYFTELFSLPLKDFDFLKRTSSDYRRALSHSSIVDCTLAGSCTECVADRTWLVIRLSVSQFRLLADHSSAQNQMERNHMT